jgi:type IV pilus assembly protein PilB
MRQPLFGELLARLVGLSDHDISEILLDQAISHRRFGEIAMSLQWCTPQHVWQAWWAQLGQSTQHVVLASAGVDTQALTAIPRSMAEQYDVIPIRVFEDQLVLATSEASQARARAELPLLVRKSIRFVLAPESQIRDAIDRYYLRKAS